MMTSLDSQFQTERFRLIPFEESHISTEYLSWLNDPILMRYSEQRHFTHTSQSARNFLMSFDNSPSRFLACVSKDSKKHFGNVVLTHDIFNNIVDVSIMIGYRDINVKRVGSEIWCFLIDSLITGSGVRKVTAGTMGSNVGMLKLFEESGMEYSSKFVDHFVRDGAFEDLIFYHKFRD